MSDVRRTALVLGIAAMAALVVPGRATAGPGPKDSESPEPPEPPEPPESISGCGILTFGPQGCLHFIHYATGLAFTLQNSDGFGAGESVFVQGPVNAELGGCFPVLLPVVENLVIEPCPQPADLNGDGAVDGADLGILLTEWGNCPFFSPCFADFDLDGDVDGADLGTLLAAWG